MAGIFGNLFGNPDLGNKGPGILPYDSPISQFVSPRRNALMGLSAGLLSGNPGSAMNGVMQGAALDRQYASDLAEQNAATQQTNATKEWLRQRGREDLIPLVDAGQGGFALQQATAVAPTPDPFTLGPGQVRYGPDGQVIAQGPGQEPQTVINNQMGGTDEFYGQLDKELATQTTSLINAGMNAQSNNIRLGELENILATAPQGVQGSFVQMASSLGLPVEGASDVQAAQALINQMVPGQRPAGSGTMSDADLALFKASLPAIINQPGGNQKILSTMKAINEYTVAQAQIAQAVANRQITPAQGRDMAAKVPNPLARGGGATAPQGTMTAPAAAPSNVIDWTGL
jgi:hypothetical protein